MRNTVAQSRARKLRSQTTDTEQHLWRYLRRRQVGGYRFRRQAPVCGYIADFACLEARVIVELDGGQHLERSRYDVSRDRRLEAEGVSVL